MLRTATVYVILIGALLISASVRSADHDADILYKHARTTLDADSAATLYKQVVEMFPRDTLAACALLRLAQYSAARGDQVAMEEYVSRLRELFPASSARKEAAALLPERSAEPVAEKKATLETPIHASSTYGVQLGAFAVKANALRMQALSSSTAPADIIERQRVKGTLYIVIAGRLSSQAEAEATLVLLEKATGIHGVIVSR